MKFLRKKMLFILGLIVGVTACKKDPGNYVYTDINEAVIKGIDSIYQVEAGHVLSITPTLTYTKDAVGDTANYSYSWLEINRLGFNSGVPRLLATGVSFNQKIAVTAGQGVYNYSFRVTDKKTNVWKEFRFQVLVANDTYEGWYLLSEIPGKQSRLDMLSYKVKTNTYEFIPDVLSKMQSQFQLKGQGSFVSYSYSGLVVASTGAAAYLSSNNLSYSPLNDFGERVEGGVNVALGLGAKFWGRASQSYLWADNMIYSRYTGNFSPINKMVGDNSPFKAAPFASLSKGFDGAILFNTTKSEFVWYPGATNIYCFSISNEDLFENEINKDLLFMKYVTYNGGETFAILKDKTGDKVYLARFTVAQQNYFGEITNTPMAQAEQFEVSDDFGYVFYSVGGKLYEYDFNTKINKEMADYGTRKISLLNFQVLDFVGAQNTPRMQELMRQLCVCTYDESNLNTSGTMDIYSVPPINGPLVKKESYTGMGKIVSVTYRNR